MFRSDKYLVSYAKVNSELHAAIYVGLRIKYSLLSSNFKQKFNVSTLRIVKFY